MISWNNHALLPKAYGLLVLSGAHSLWGVSGRRTQNHFGEFRDMSRARTGETPYNQRHKFGAVIALGYCKSVSHPASRVERFTQHDNLPLGLPLFHPICAESTYKSLYSLPYSLPAYRQNWPRFRYLPARLG
jgi:hypothetical protein